MYHITEYTYDRAKHLGVQVFPSDNPKYKLEVYDKNGVFITYCGANGYKDFPTYMAEKGWEYAKRRRELYKIRHQKDRTKVGSRGYYADQLLW
jgi:hypothetical protein